MDYLDEVAAEIEKIPARKRTVHQKLVIAYGDRRGIRLSQSDVVALVSGDECIVAAAEPREDW